MGSQFHVTGISTANISVRLQSRSLNTEHIICDTINYIMAVLLLIGSSVDVYVFAEGINLEHEEFEGRAFDGGYGQSKKCSKDFGTYVASLAVGKSDGVATKANVYRYGLSIVQKVILYSLLFTCFLLYSINVLNCQLSGFFSDVIKGIQYVTSRTKLTGRRSVIALPLLGSLTKAVDVAIKKAVKENIVVVASAGK